jgi:hypothetical protein
MGICHSINFIFQDLNLLKEFLLFLKRFCCGWSIDFSGFLDTLGPSLGLRETTAFTVHEDGLAIGLEVFGLPGLWQGLF